MSMNRLDWRTSTPAELLDGKVALTLTEVAAVLSLTVARGTHKGEPCKRQAYALVADGRLRAIDPSQPIGRLTVSCASVRHYLATTAAPIFTLVQGATA